MASQIDITKDIQPLTTFRNHSVEFMQQLKATQRPIILTVNGKPEAVLQDAAAYQRLLDIAVLADVHEGILGKNPKRLRNLVNTQNLKTSSPKTNKPFKTNYLDQQK